MSADEDRNSLLYWWPAVQRLGIPAPDTEIVMIPDGLLEGILGHEPEKLAEAGWPKFFQAVADAADRMGGYPVFLRTDILSGKHNWDDTCYVPSLRVLEKHIGALIEESYIPLGIPDPQAFVVREFLPLQSAFKAFHGLPISLEWRLFAQDGELECLHFYWTPDAIKGWGRYKLPKDWKQQLANLASIEPPVEVEAWARAVTKELGGAWSVDVACDMEGQWHLIDMAEAERNWHPGHA